jgi:TetR/AcrR family transcriptional regulator, transcriptional repressor for nem operon
MRVSQAKAAENRDRIVAEAARLFGERGIDGVGIDAIMQAAGLTHGGFYRHFGSKEDLVAAAVDRRLSQSASLGDVPAELKPYLDSYLSARHRDDPGGGCAMAALGCDVARGGDEVRRRFTEAVAAQVDRFRGWLGDRRGERSRDRALLAVSAMVGAMVLARAVDDPALSEDLLAAARSGIAEL